MPPETANSNVEETLNIPVLATLSAHAHWFLRIALASVFVFHGIGKFPTAAGMAEMMGMPVAMIYLLGTMELMGGLLVLAGGFKLDWATRLGALLIVPVMIGAIALVHWPRWSFTSTEQFPMGGMEFQVTLLLVALYLVVKGNSVIGNAGRDA